MGFSHGLPGLALALALGCAAVPAPPSGTAPAPFTGTVERLDEAAAPLDQLLAAPLTVLAFATVWCEACETEWPELVAWATREDATVVYVMSGSGEDDVASAMARREGRPSKLHVVVDESGAVADHYGVQATPTLFLKRATGWEGPRRHLSSGLTLRRPHRRSGRCGPGRPPSPALSDHGRELGTSYAVRIEDPTPTASADLQAVRSLLRSLEAELSEWRADSAISRLNQEGHPGPVPLTAALREVLAGALHVSNATEGAFDPTWATLAPLWRDARVRSAWPSAAELRAARAGVGAHYLQLSGTSARLGHPKTRVGIAGVAKGYIIDRVFLYLRARGHEGVTVNIGGDLRTSGQTELELMDPFRPNYSAGKIGIQDTAVATSGNYLRGFEIGGRRAGHILDPRTGQPPPFAGSVSVLTRDTAMADALATALFILGPEQGLTFARATPGVDAVFVTRDGWRSTLARRDTMDPRRSP